MTFLKSKVAQKIVLLGMAFLLALGAFGISNMVAFSSLGESDTVGASAPLGLSFQRVSALWSGSSGGVWPHIKTFGFLYDDLALRDPVEAAWIAERFDMVITGSVTNETAYDLLKGANPDIKLVGYISASQEAVEYMINWCQQNGYNPEDLFYHYEVDTTVRLRNQKTETVRGYPHGSAASLEDARAMESWSARWTAICPTSPVFRKAYTQYVVDKRFTVNAAAGKYIDGEMWDTFEMLVDPYYDLQLENTAEMRAIGCGTPELAKEKAREDLMLLRNEIEQELTRVSGKETQVIPNAAETSYIFSGQSTMYADAFDGEYNEVAIEYLTTSLRTRMHDCRFYTNVYDTLESGVCMMINSETTWYTPDQFSKPLNTQQWEDFRQFALAAQYLINHPNAYFAFHNGSASYYGGYPNRGNVRQSHWNVNYEYNIGRPVIRNGADAWGAAGTDRFFVMEEKRLEYKILAREYENALVVAKFGSENGQQYAVGDQQATHALGGNYRRLLADNTLGPVITEITLGKGGGAILIKVDENGAPVSGGTINDGGETGTGDSGTGTDSGSPGTVTGSGNSSGGSSGGSSSDRRDSAKTTGNSWVNPEETYWIENADALALAEKAKETQLAYAVSNKAISTGIRMNALHAISEYQYRHNTVIDGSVQVRITIPEPKLAAGDLLVSGYVNGALVDKRKAFMEKWYRNKTRVIQLEQQEAWGQRVKIAAKVDFKGMDTSKLHFYSYDRKKNIVHPFATEYAIDEKGYLHFSTELAGDIVISDGPLETK